MGSGDGRRCGSAGCPFVQRLNTDGGPLREVAAVLVPFADPLQDSNYRIQIRELAVGEGSVWVLGDAADRRLWRLDELTGETQATIDLPFPPRSVAVGEGKVWITDSLDDTVVPVDPANNQLLAPVPVGRGAAGVAAGAGAVWVANAIDGTVSRIDPGTRQVVSTIDVGGIPHELAVDRARSLGDDSCAVAAVRARGAVLGSVLLFGALLQGCTSDPAAVRIGVLADCVGTFRNLQEAALSGAAIPLLERGATLRGPSASRRRQRRNDRRSPELNWCPAASRAANTARSSNRPGC